MDAQKKTYQIQVISKIEDSEGELNEMTLYTEATYKRAHKKAFLMYDETEVSGMENTKTLISFDGEVVQIKRYGALKSLLNIEKDVSHDNLYATPYGTFLMKTKGLEVVWNDGDAIDIELSYLLEIESDKEEISKVHIKIDVKRD
ncbi:MAG TPA: DUF1934 domain-containing protein [Fusibacter sp.]|nr:DUF1934 domain-containing protein [Fusibacter sp.]